MLFIEPTNKYAIAASTEKAYNRSENKFIHVGETVYLKCTSDGSHRGTGVVTGMAKRPASTTWRSPGGEFYIAETVSIYRRSDYAESSRIGRGTVAAAKVVAIKGSGSILKMHVENGDFVERGELLFETVTGTLDGLYAPGNEIICEVSGNRGRAWTQARALPWRRVEKSFPFIPTRARALKCRCAKATWDLCRRA